MNALEKTLKDIENYPKQYIPLATFCKMVGIKRNTIANQICKKMLKARSDGYRYHIHKDSAKEVAIKNRGALLGWVRQRDIMKEFSVSSQLLHHVCKSRNLFKEQDFCGYVRFSLETVLAIKELLPLYLSKEIVKYHDKTYYAVTKLAHDMTMKVEKDCRIARFKSEEERIYKCIHNWCQRELIPYIKIPGKTSLYVPDFIYDDLVEKIRITDSALLCDMSRRTIYNWIEKGILPTTTSPSGSTLINIKDLDNALILRTQIDLMKKHISDPEKINEISEFESNFWHSEVRSLRDLGGAFRREKRSGNTSDINKLIGSMDGWDKVRMRTIRAISKRRTRTDEVSLDASLNDSDDDNYSLINHLEDKTAPCPSEHLDSIDMLSLIEELPLEDNEMICRLFGMKDYEPTSIGQLSQEKNIPITDLQNRIDGVLNSLKDKLK